MANKTDKTRVQVPLERETYEHVNQLAKDNRRTLGAMCVELIEHALSSPDFESASIKSKFKADVVKGAINGVDLSRDKLSKLIKLLEAID
jgi:aconitase B